MHRRAHQQRGHHRGHEALVRHRRGRGAEGAGHQRGGPRACVRHLPAAHDRARLAQAHRQHVIQPGVHHAHGADAARAAAAGRQQRHQRQWRLSRHACSGRQTEDSCCGWERQRRGWRCGHCYSHQLGPKLDPAHPPHPHLHLLHGVQVQQGSSEHGHRDHGSGPGCRGLHSGVAAPRLGGHPHGQGVRRQHEQGDEGGRGGGRTQHGTTPDRPAVGAGPAGGAAHHQAGADGQLPWLGQGTCAVVKGHCCHLS
mmetsp:Transcript_37047/g.93430  ORF Transcript_37047/g.93430 Transcript_37047/m.93430 type:complete len:254 (-) Transcript_37047:308-1069(-)